MSKIIAQIIIQGTAILSRAFVSAYQQALASNSFVALYFFMIFRCSSGWGRECCEYGEKCWEVENATR